MKTELLVKAIRCQFMPCADGDIYCKDYDNCPFSTSPIPDIDELLKQSVDTIESLLARIKELEAKQ